MIVINNEVTDNNKLKLDELIHIVSKIKVINNKKYRLCFVI